MTKSLLNQKFLSLDLEYNQPSRTIIQVGVAIGSMGQSEEEYVVKDWIIETQEQLDEKIVSLTGITQQQVNQGVRLQDCAAQLCELINQHDIFVNPVTWGGGDAEDLKKSFMQNSIHFPHFGRRHIDVKTLATYLSFSRASGMQSASGGLSSIMSRYKLQFVGNPHQAHHDALNTLRLFFRLLERQHTLESAAFLCQKL